MKRALSDKDDDSSSDESSSSQTGTGDSEKASHAKTRDHSNVERASKKKTSEVKLGKKKSGAMDFESLRRYGYKGGLSVLNVPPPKETDEKKDWSWSTGRESRETSKVEESYEEQQKTRAAIMDGEQLANVQTRKEKKNLSFSQKEKRKRELGQASRGKNYVEEEKRLLRESGDYSGFDT